MCVHVQLGKHVPQNLVNLKFIEPGAILEFIRLKLYVNENGHCKIWD